MIEPFEDQHAFSGRIDPESDAEPHDGSIDLDGGLVQATAEKGNAEPATPPVPGPGIAESLLWTFGVLAVHVVGVIATFAALTFLGAATQANQAHFEAIRYSARSVSKIAELNPSILVGGEMLVFVLCVVAAVFLRYGLDAPRRLGVRRLPNHTVFLIVLMTVPLALVSAYLFSWLDAVIPSTDFLVKNSPMSEVTRIAKSTSTPFLLLILALAPAIGEELVFRGVIGRGLVARYGVLIGVLCTSTLFGIVHLHPAHAVALLPLAFVIHLLYLATRSFWAPVLLHFLNNAWAVLVLKLYGSADGTGAADTGGVAMPLFISAAVFVVAAMHLIWRSRVQFMYPDGTTWNPGYATAERPPAHLQLEPQQAPVTALSMTFAVASFVAFAGTLLGGLIWVD